jgi:hypothetical protein
VDTARSAVLLGLILGACLGIGFIAGSEWNAREVDRVSARAALALDSAALVYRDSMRTARAVSARVDTVTVTLRARVRRLVDTLRVTDTLSVFPLYTPHQMTAVRHLIETADSLERACGEQATACERERQLSDRLIAAQRAALDSLRIVSARPSTSRMRSRWQAVREGAAWLGAGVVLGAVVRR